MPFFFESHAQNVVKKLFSDPFLNIKIDDISLDKYSKILQFVFIVFWQVEGYRNIFDLGCWPLAFTSYMAFFKNNKSSEGNISLVILLADQISLSGCYYFVRYWACVS